MLTPSPQEDHRLEIGADVLAIVAVLWAAFVTVIRPLWDNLVFTAWRRKTADVDDHVHRILKDDFQHIHDSIDRLHQSVEDGNSETHETIRQMAQEQGRLAGNVEQLTRTVAELARTGGRVPHDH